MTADWTPLVEMRERLAVIEVAATHFHGVAEIEHLLVDLTRFMESGKLDRRSQVESLIELTRGPRWPYGAIDTLEFTMRRLLYPEIEHHLLTLVKNGSNLTVQQCANRVLEVYGSDWPGGEIYRTYGSGTG